MSKENDNDPVTGKLCKAYRQLLDEKINGVKKTIIASSATATAIIILVQFVLTLS